MPISSVPKSEAEKILGETKVDLVVCDLSMPALIGLDFLELSREQRDTPTISSDPRG